jgi:hypothetical protein
MIGLVVVGKPNSRAAVATLSSVINPPALHPLRDFAVPSLSWASLVEIGSVSNEATRLFLGRIGGDVGFNGRFLRVERERGFFME